MDKFTAASDLHGDMQDPRALKQFRTFVEDYKPKYRYFLGDLFDFRALRIGASADERMESLRADFDAGMDFLDWYRPTVITLGNHDQRLWDRVSKGGMRKANGPLSDLSSLLIEQFEDATRKMGTTVLPYDKRLGVHRKAGLAFTHGFDRNNATDMARLYGDVLFGHGHRVEAMPGPSQGRLHPPTGYMVGCLCKLDQDYNRAQTRTLEQQHGWAYGLHGRTSSHVMQAKMVNGKTAIAPALTVLS